MLSVNDWPVYVELTNGEIYGCDLVVSAVGVEANLNPLNRSPSNVDNTTHNTGNTYNINNKGTEITESSNLNALFHCASMEHGGGLLVNEQMETNWKDVYAAGDCAYANWTWSPHWFQMKLWSQARQMGFQVSFANFFLIVTCIRIYAMMFVYLRYFVCVKLYVQFCKSFNV